MPIGSLLIIFDLTKKGQEAIFYTEYEVPLLHKIYFV